MTNIFWRGSKKENDPTNKINWNLQWQQTQLPPHPVFSAKSQFRNFLPFHPFSLSTKNGSILQNSNETHPLNSESFCNFVEAFSLPKEDDFERGSLLMMSMTKMTFQMMTSQRLVVPRWALDQSELVLWSRVRSWPRCALSWKWDKILVKRATQPNLGEKWLYNSCSFFTTRGHCKKSHKFS